eukprot:6892581-Pyramimonas_sp.AAC.1
MHCPAMPVTAHRHASHTSPTIARASTSSAPTRLRSLRTAQATKFISEANPSINPGENVSLARASTTRWHVPRIQASLWIAHTSLIMFKSE